MPRPAIVWSIVYDSVDAMDQDPTARATTTALTAQAASAPAPTVPTDDQFVDARDKARRLVAAAGADCTITIDLDANGVMTVQVNRKA